MGMVVYHIHQSQKGGIKEKMNTIRKIRKNAKALSPVVASIILIAVTVAVSIAVAAWMGALVVGQMATEELKITGMDFTVTTDPANEFVVVTAKNTGTTSVTISDIFVNGDAQATVT